MNQNSQELYVLNTTCYAVDARKTKYITNLKFKIFIVWNDYLKSKIKNILENVTSDM